MGADERQRYKLRLQDGTVLVVDYDGLSTWLVDGRAMVQAVGSRQWRPLKEFLAEARIAARAESRRKAKEVKPAVALPLVPPPPRDAPVRIQEPEPKETPAERAPEERPEEPVDAAPSPPSEASIDVSIPDPDPAAPPPPLPVLEEPPSPLVLEETPLPDAVSESGGSAIDASVAPVPSEILAEEEPTPHVATAWRDAVEPRFGGVRAEVQALADDPGDPDAGYRTPPVTLDAELPRIPFKPLDDLDGAVRAAAENDDVEDEDVAVDSTPAPVPYARRRTLLDDVLLSVFSAGDRVVTRWVESLSRSRGARASAAARPAPGPARAKRPALGDRVSAWTEAFIEWIGRVTRTEAPPRPVPPHEPAGRSPARAEPREVLKAPPPISELPVLRLADIDEPEEPADVYDGEAPAYAVWPWVRRLAATVVLVAGVSLAVATRESWTPRAVGLGRRLFTEVDTHTQSRNRSEREERLLLEARERLPHLAPETIRLVLAQDPDGVFDSTEVFRVAYEAGARGVSALTPPEEAELKALQDALLGALRPAERQRLDDYERARVRRVTLPFEDRDALQLFAKGVDALALARRERLQQLHARAVAAGLGAGPPASP